MTSSLTDPDDTCIESRTPNTNEGKPEDLEDSLNQYANWLADAVPETPEFRQFCELWPARFVELCKFHLSVLIDLPLEIWDDSTNAVCGTNVVGSKKLFPDLVSREPMVSRLITNGQLRRTPKPWARLRGTTPNVERADVDNARYAIHRPNRVQHGTGTSGGLNNKTCANEAIVQNLLSLMDALDNKENLANEGIFRKTGNMQRQRCVRRRIMTEKQLDIQSLMCYVEPKPWKPAGNRRWIQSHLTQSVPVSAPPSPMLGVHDLAAALKGVLYDLPEPLLTDRLLPLFVQVAGLTSGRLDDRGRRVTLRPIEEKIACAKQLKAVRLLCRLLPETHTVLFKRLLVLLEHTLQYASSNRMTAESLGLLFGPVLFSPSKVPTRDLHTQYTNLARLATMMITQGVYGLWYIPKSFLQDVERNRLLYMELSLPQIADRDNSSLSSASLPSLQNDYTTSILERANSNDSGLGLTDGSQPSSDMDSAVVPPLRVDELPALVTCINFTVRHSSDKDPTTNGETEYAVAELCAAVQSLPDNDPRKRRLVNRFNATNGGLLPPPTSGPGVPKHTTPHSSLYRPIARLNRDWSSSLGDVSSGRFIRAHAGNSAFKAAKTIRSSLRRRLALRSNVSVTGCFNSPRNLVKPLIECRSEMDFEYSQTHTSVDRKPGTLAQVTDHSQMFVLDSGHQLSPIFDTNCPPEVFGSCESLHLPAPPETVMAANTRCSIMSTTSISSVGAGDLLFCCPLVEAIASPFRKLTTPGSQGRTPDSGVTPLARVFRGGLKRLRGRSPRVGLLRNEVISFIPPLQCEDLTPVDNYYPIEFDEPLGSKLKNSECLDEIDRPMERISGRFRRKPIRQKTITSFGYRTVAHISCQSPMNRSVGHHLRRSQTMPSIPWLLPLDKEAKF